MEKTCGQGKSIEFPRKKLALISEIVYREYTAWALGAACSVIGRSKSRVPVVIVYDISSLAINRVVAKPCGGPAQQGKY